MAEDSDGSARSGGGRLAFVRYSAEMAFPVHTDDQVQLMDDTRDAVRPFGGSAYSPNCESTKSIPSFLCKTWLWCNSGMLSQPSQY